MASERNRSLELKEYFSKLGIDVKMGKTKARGHRGVFMHSFNKYRIDISKNLDEPSVLSTMLHEFAHYVHYKYDKNLKSLDFVFGDFTDDIKEELIKVTVQEIPKDFAMELYNIKNSINNEIKNLLTQIKISLPNFKLSEKNKEIERTLSNPIKYLLRYDNVKCFNHLYSVDNIESDYNLTDIQKNYIKIKSKQRALKRINSKICRLNKYYNNNSELFARFVDAYYTKPELIQKIAPNACAKFGDSKIKYFDQLDKILTSFACVKNKNEVL